MMGSVSLINGHIDDDITDEQIIKALEICLSDLDCPKCPYVDYEGDEFCSIKMLKDVLDLINRQKANAEGLTNAVKFLNEQLSSVKAEAVKEFAEAYKDQIEDCTGMFTDEGFYVPLDAVLNAVDFIRERLVGDTDV